MNDRERERAFYEHQRRRFERPDWERYYKPDWRDQKYWNGEPPPEWVKHPGDMAFLKRDPRTGRWIDEQAEAEEKRREDEFWAGHFEVKRLAADLKRHLRERLQEKYDPDQPRVPAGNADGGQWTNGEGGDARSGINDSRVISDATPDNAWTPGAQYAQNVSQRRYSVNLDEEERRGGHTQRDHVGKTDEELMARVRADRGQIGIIEYARERHGSFVSAESANDFVNRTLERHQGMVNEVADGRSARAFLNERFGNKTGREAFRPHMNAEPYLRDTYEVGVEIRHDPRSTRGYRVHTAYPRNSAPR